MRYLLVLLNFFFISFVFAQTIDESAVPPKVKSALLNKFPIKGTPDWEKTSEGYTSYFYLGDLKGTAVFKEDGTYLKSEEEVAPDNLPTSVKNYVAANFKSLKIDYARKYDFADAKDNYYYVTASKVLKDGKKYTPEFSLSPEGKLISENYPKELESFRLSSTGNETTVTKTKVVKKTTVGYHKPVDKSASNPNENIPQAVAEHFSKKFRGATSVKWNVDDYFFTADFMLRNLKSFAIYDNEANYIKFQSDIPVKSILPPVMKTLVSTYPEYKILSGLNTVAADNQKHNEFQLVHKKDANKTLEVWTTQTGQIIKEINPNATETETASIEDIPDAVKITFNKKYLKATDIRWEKSAADSYIATFFFKGEKISAEFSADGNWIESKKTVAIAKLPQPVLTAIASSKYKKDKIMNSTYIENSYKQKYYFIETRTESKKSSVINKLQISPAGKFLEESSEADTSTPVEETKEVKKAPKSKESKPQTTTTKSSSNKSMGKTDAPYNPEIDEQELKKAEEMQKKAEEKRLKEEEKKSKKNKKQDEEIEKDFQN